MAEEGTTIETTPETTPETPAVADYSEQFGKISEQLENVTGQLSQFEERLGAFEKPAEPTTPVTTEAPKSWDEVYATAEKKAEDKFNSLLEDQKKETETAQAAEADRNKQIDTAINNQIAELEANKAIPVIVDDNNPEDPGRVARMELFGLAAKRKSIDLIGFNEDLRIAHEAGYTFSPQLGRYIKSGTQPSGADAPISSPSHITTPAKMSAKDIVNARSFDEIVDRYQ